MPKNATGTPQGRSKRRSTVRFATPESSPTRRKGGSKRSNSRFSNSSAKKTRTRNSDAPSDYFDPREDTFVDGPSEAEDGEDGSEDDDDTFWEDEETMLADLLQESPDDMPEHRRADHLVNKLQPAFDAESRVLKTEFASAFIPLIKNAMALAYNMDIKHDKKFLAGINSFDDACRATEATHIRLQDDLKKLLATFMTSMDDLATQLDDALKERERIWKRYEQAVDALVEPLVEELQALPGLCESRISTLDKEAKKISKANSASQAEAKMKAFMKRMA